MFLRNSPLYPSIEKHLFIVLVPCFGSVIITYSGYPGYFFVISRINSYNSEEFSFYDRPCGLHSYCQYLIHGVPVDSDLYLKKYTKRKEGEIGRLFGSKLTVMSSPSFESTLRFFYHLGHSIFNPKAVQILISWPSTFADHQLKFVLVSSLKYEHLISVVGTAQFNPDRPSSGVHFAVHDVHFDPWPRSWPSTLGMISNLNNCPLKESKFLILDMSSFLPTEIFKNFRISLHAKI